MVPSVLKSSHSGRTLKAVIVAAVVFNLMIQKSPGQVAGDGCDVDVQGNCGEHLRCSEVTPGSGNFTCDCPDTSVTYFNTSSRTCEPRRGYQAECSNSNMCLKELLCKTLTDDPYYFGGTTRCLCKYDDLLYFNGEECKERSPYGSPCNVSGVPANSCMHGLTCDVHHMCGCPDPQHQYYLALSTFFKRGICVCVNTTKLYFNDDTHKCTPRQGSGQSCNNGDSCDIGLACISNCTNPFECDGGVCACRDPSNHFFNTHTKTCEGRISVGSSCDAVGVPSDSCVLPMELLAASLTPLTCNGHTCSCPNVEEYYFNPIVSACTRRVAYGHTCDQTYPQWSPFNSCVTGLACDNATCSCPDPETHYFNDVRMVCEPRRKYSESCATRQIPPDECETGLTCVDKMCSCNSDTHYFSTGFENTTSKPTCLPRGDYGHACLEENQKSCVKDLLCSKNATCVCPNKIQYFSVTSKTCLPDMKSSNDTHVMQVSSNRNSGPRTRDAAFTASICVILIVSISILTYVFLQRRRNITMMKLAHWFRHYEDDDERKYDAFVSYVSNDVDTKFVVQTLLPMLEDRHHFSLCVHQRNFLPGQFIAENITSAVKLSRRTILVISPSFLHSEWCRFEYQVALQEMLVEKHRILPVFLCDVRDCQPHMDDTLTSLLKSVTWLRYPGQDADHKDMDRFWTRLVLSMPKKQRQCEA